VYDAARQVVVMFGGYDAHRNPLADTWLWDGSDWLPQAPLTHPSARFSYSMTYDSAHQQTLLFGGTGGNGDLADTWAWDGTTWTQRTPPTNPPARQAAAMTFDTLHQQPVLFGGDSANADLNDTWVWLAPSTNLVAQAPTAALDGHGNYLVTITLKNQGNVPITNLFIASAKLGSVASAVFPGGAFLAAIEPGATGSFTAQFPIASIAGNSAPVSFQGTYSSVTAVAAPWTASARNLNLP
jgi:hypothetical protein